ncbi:tetratricopeptide repeat-containing sensor histidine kinase [Pedobacter sp. UBA4863]|mgnify:CR=1 FL=1|uniref:tetratricopeptide repeat-containing sensor histidine kinase n=1 Tax=Pedobacter sp. UBA4863 TaxID=1947060 RepID=UPI0025D59865|nr:tetratricopeptide repeat-containing sensor histidine kinase [Pedobacter sp. UBA4863]
MLQRQKALFSLGLLCLFSFLVVAQVKPNKLETSQQYVNIVRYYRYLNPDSARFYVNEGIKKADKEKDNLGKAALLNQLGMIEDNSAHYAEAKQLYLQAEVIYREANDEKGLASTLIRLSVVEKRKGNYDKSLALAMNALKISEKIKDKLGLLEARIVLSEIYYILDNTRETLTNLTIAEAIDSSIPTSNFSLNMYIGFGYLYTKLGQYQKAIDYLHKGLAKANKVEFNGLKISLYKVLAITYAQKGDKEKAIAYFKYSLDFTRKIKNMMREQSTLIELSEVYSSPDSSLFYLKQALVIANKFKMSRQQITILDKMSKMHKNKGQFKEALLLKEQSSELAEQVFYKDMAKQVVSLETAYELEKSKAKLNQLTTKSREQQLAKNVILSIAIGVFLVLVITLVYNLRSRRLNKLLRKANEGLEESNGVKDKLFSIIAHDIRSPLVSTVGIMKLISNGELDEQTQQQMVNKLVAHCDNSLDILDKLLKWGQMQIKGVRLNTSIFDPMPNIRRNIALLEDSANKKHIRIIVDVPLNIKLEADSDHFDFIMRNLVANAIKFTTNNGTIKVEAKMQSPGMVRFFVIDNGVGISKNRVKNLFNLESISTRGTSAEEGTSLGLIICKDFVLANKGELDVESEVGVGTTFSFTLKGTMV